MRWFNFDVYDEWNVANYNFESFKNGRSVTRIIHINSLDVLWFKKNIKRAFDCRQSAVFNGQVIMNIGL
jgi:hypothetical protein